MMLFVETVVTWNNYEFGVDMEKEKTMLGMWNSHINSLTEEAEAKKDDNKKNKKEKTKAKNAEKDEKKSKKPRSK
jgi:hypothetical protein